MNNTILGIFIVLLGLAMGSFYACMGYRIPNKISTVKERSFCPKCKKQLKWYMNIPVFSYIFLGGRCAYCKKKISLIYPAIEISSAFLYFLAFELYINTAPVYYLNFFLALILTSAFLITSVSDFIYYYISDRVVLCTIVFSLTIKYIFLGFTETLYSILAGVILFAVMLLIKFIGDKIFKKESLGGGDIKLVGAIGCIIGIVPSLISLFIASVFGLIFALFAKSDNKSGIIPFGPFLLFASLLCLYFETPLNFFIENILGLM